MHSLVHRREAHNVGEYGMVGYSNANYWSNAAHSSSGADTLPYGEMRRAILEASEQFGQEARDWCQERIVDEGGDDAEYWESRTLHELCVQVSQESSDFRSNGSIVIRNVLVPVPDGGISQEAAASASAGIAARLLDTPAVCDARMAPADTDADDVLCILLPWNEKDAHEISDLICSAVGGGGSLSARDIFSTTGDVAVQNSIGAWRKYTACSKDNSAAVFVDSLHGTKGETPTTVIQWSKGTVHHKSQ